MYLLLFIILLPQIVQLATVDENAKVMIYVRSLNGKIIKDGRVIIHSDKGEVILDKAVDNSIEVRLAYGQYKVTFTSFLTYETTRAISVNKSEMFVMLAGPTLLQDTPRVKASVLVETTPSTRCHSDDVFWVKLVSIYSDYSAEQALSSWGNTLFEQIDHGAYTISVMDGTEVRGMKAFSTRGPETRVHVDLSPCQNH